MDVLRPGRPCFWASHTVFFWGGALEFHVSELAPAQLPKVQLWELAAAKNRIHSLP